MEVSSGHQEGRTENSDLQQPCTSCLPEMSSLNSPLHGVSSGWLQLAFSPPHPWQYRCSWIPGQLYKYEFRKLEKYLSSWYMKNNKHTNMRNAQIIRHQKSTRQSSLGLKELVSYVASKEASERFLSYLVASVVFSSYAEFLNQFEQKTIDMNITHYREHQSMADWIKSLKNAM